ncbi:MAG: hypothetical protein Q4D87_05915 [Actinomycetaceae bacterium]|nr:hypothetical protein [Actinomycetaceae bacterium]
MLSNSVPSDSTARPSNNDAALTPSDNAVPQANSTSANAAVSSASVPTGSSSNDTPKNPETTSTSASAGASSGKHSASGSSSGSRGSKSKTYTQAAPNQAAAPAGLNPADGTSYIPAIWRWITLLTGGASLLIGLNLALNLIAVWAPIPAHTDASLHGQIMTLGFLGTLITLERVVALRSRTLLIAPLSLGIGSILLLTPHPQWGQSLQIIGMAGLLLTYIKLTKRDLSNALAIQIIGSIAGLAAATLWALGAQTHTLIPLISTFIVLTILGERVELARISLTLRAERLAFALSALLMATSLALLAGAPSEIYATNLLLITAWLTKHDIARRMATVPGLPRYSATNMLLATAWLGLGSLTWLLTGPLATSSAYDSIVHAILLGYGMSMIFAHAPIILPAVLKLPLPYHPLAWIPTIALNLGILIRFYANVRSYPTSWQIGATLTVIAILLFLAASIYASATSNKQGAKQAAKQAAKASTKHAPKQAATLSIKPNDKQTDEPTTKPNDRQGNEQKGATR